MLSIALWACVALPMQAPAAAPTPAPAVAPAPSSGNAPEALATREDVLWASQVLVALGAASVTGLLALVPATGVFVFMALMAISAQAPLALLLGGLALVGMAALVQALAAGVAVWAMSLLSVRFRARHALPTVAWNALRSFLHQQDAQPNLMLQVLGLPFLPLAAGYLAGALLGVLAAVILSAPVLAVALLLVQTPRDNVLGTLALPAAFMLSGALVAALPLLLGPVMAATTYHLNKEPVEDAGAAPRR
jgi:hypothetical protein